MTIFSGEGKGGGAYFEFHIQQGRLIEGGRLFEEIRYQTWQAHFLRNSQGVQRFVGFLDADWLDRQTNHMANITHMIVSLWKGMRGAGSLLRKYTSASERIVYIIHVNKL